MDLVLHKHMSATEAYHNLKRDPTCVEDQMLAERYGEKEAEKFRSKGFDKWEATWTANSAKVDYINVEDEDDQKDSQDEAPALPPPSSKGGSRRLRRRLLRRRRRRR